MDPSYKNPSFQQQPGCFCGKRTMHEWHQDCRIIRLLPLSDLKFSKGGWSMLRHWIGPFVLGLLLVGAPALRADDEDSSPQRRATLGVRIVPPQQAGNQQQEQGAIVGEVMPNGPAAKAGLAQGDVITKAGNQNIRTYDELVNAIAKQKSGDKLELHVRRNGQDKTMTVTLGSQQRALLPPGGGPGQRQEGPPRQILPPGGGPGQRQQAFLGVGTESVTPEMRNQLGIAAEHGSLVTEVVPDSPAAHAGLKRDDVITSVNGKAVNDAAELREMIRSAGAGKEVHLKVARGKETKDITARLESAPAAAIEMMPPFGDMPRYGQLPPFADQSGRIRQLEQRVEQLERQLHELQQKQGQGRGSGSPR
jgi:membrane-associated protease RseP (regulator of RpoE activity)